MTATAEAGAPTDARTRHEQLRLVVDDERLNTLLDPLRSNAPLKVVCGKCQHRLVYLGLRAATAMVVFSEHGPNPRVRRQAKPSWVGPQPPEPFNYWSVNDYSSGVDHPTPTDAGASPGKALRWRFACTNPRCHAHYDLTNTTLLRRFVLALARSENETRL